ncbi:hypothetical protein ACRAQ7_01540 [Erythrobacter sp. W53]|uniref:hypothetical protein n=1 Tax=Erythrobacter sp. W53 TaxID=3425947 RepID=UPI003D768867
MPASMYQRLDNAQASPKLAAALGDMLLAWTAAEQAQIEAMAAMLNVAHNNCMRIYQKLPNFRSRTQMLKLLIEQNPEFEPILTEVEAISKLSKTRNRYVHGGFIESKDEIRSVDYEKSSGHERRSVSTKPSDITNHANAVRTRAENLTGVLKSLGAYQRWIINGFPELETNPNLRNAQQSIRKKSPKPRA